MDLPAGTLSEPTNIELHGDEYWPLSGKSYFHIVLSESHVKPRYLMAVPASFQSIIPSLTVPVHLAYRGKDWKMVYTGAKFKTFVSGWKAFVEGHHLKAGDACVFELTDCSKEKLKFRVQILRGDIPSEFLDKANGNTVGSPIIIE